MIRTIFPIPLFLAVAICAAAVSLLPSACAAGEAAGPAKLGEEFEIEIRPLLARYCQECHGPELAEGEIDFAAILTWADVTQHVPMWQKASEMLSGGLMPPDDASQQPTAAERDRLLRWVDDYLALEASARAGDPGRVVLRRLNNAEYTYTLRDLTGVDSLDPAEQFPVDGAAGEGFTNTGNSLVMSPTLMTKYIDAAEEVAGHAVLLPTGFRFSPHTTSRDWTEEILAEIRALYGRDTEPLDGVALNLQGVKFESNDGRRLPFEKYLAATLHERERLTSGSETIERAARKHGLNAKYFGILWSTLTATTPSPVLDGLRARWRAAKPDAAAELAGEIAAWQKGLWSFASVGHIGKVGGPTRWLEPVSPLVTQQEVRFPIPAATNSAEVVLSLVATDAGDGNEHDTIIWQRPRLVAPGRPDLLLRDVRRVARQWASQREQLFADTAAYLRAAAEADAKQGDFDVAAMAQTHGVSADGLQAWLDYLGIAAAGRVEVVGHFTDRLAGVAGYDFVSGWGTGATPLLVANSSDQHVRIPGNMQPHGVAVHPSPTLRVAVGWSSPVVATIRVEGVVTHAHPECGNGVTWALELRRGTTRRQLTSSTAQGARVAQVGPIENLVVRPGDLLSLLIGPRDGNHSCDLTAIDLTITSDDGKQTWNLAADVSGSIGDGNPHADRFGNAGVWHFYTEPVTASEGGPTLPADSVLARWRSAANSADKSELAAAVQALLLAGPPAEADSPDAVLYRQLTSVTGPLVSSLRSALVDSSGTRANAAESGVTADSSGDLPAWGLEPAQFGVHPTGAAVDADSLCVRAPSVLEVRLPADLVSGCELVVTGVLDPATGSDGSVQLKIVPGKAAEISGLLPSSVTVAQADGRWTDDNRRLAYATPILVSQQSAARTRLEAALAEFRDVFPLAVCYTKIVPIDEVVTLTLYYREDDHLQRLLLDPPQIARLERLWDELHYVSRSALAQVDALAQLIEYATQDANPTVFEPLRGPAERRAAEFRQLLLDSEPRHFESLLALAERAYRRPLAAPEAQALRGLYDSLRRQDIAHDEAFRLTLARVLVAPAFLYRIEIPPAGATQRPVSSWELASRLSYFLWSSQPDDELRRAAADGELHDVDALLAQTRRLLRDAKVRRLATEFGCQWLHIRDFESTDEKSERHFPTFAALRGPMFEESVQFFTDLFQNNRSVLDIIDADYTFLNEELAAHYGIPGVVGAEWRRVDSVKQYARGGILAQATTLATQSGASRTSPILRGNWISEVILGERLPKPPKGVPPLPDDEADTDGFTVRQLVEQHMTDEKCAVCHRRIDPYGFALEAFDAIGRHRDKDLGNRPVDTRVTVLDGSQFDGLDGLRNYLLTTRRDTFVRHFCQKLLGYALGRAVQLSDRPLIAEMQRVLAANDYRVVAAVETIVRSPQFREMRGRDTTDEVE